MTYFFFLCLPLGDMVAREGHPCIEKGINMTYNLIEIIVEIREIVLFTRATPGISLV